MPTMTLRVSDETSQALDALAKATDRSKSYLIQRAIDDYVALNAWHGEAIREGIAEADAGELVEHHTLKQRWEGKLADSLD
jgi:predicted transcriptional regulator